MWAPTPQQTDSSKPLNPGKPIPRPGHRKRPMTDPKPQNAKTSKRRKILLSILIVVVIVGILVTAGYFIKRLIDSKYFFCKSSVKFIPLDKACDGNRDCSGGEDEITCLSSFTENTTFPVRLTTSKHVLQVYSPGSGWKTMCSDNWTEKHTQTACQQLGYTNSPTSSTVKVGSLQSLLKSQTFCAVGNKSPSTPVHEATTERRLCSSGSVISLKCSDCGEVGNQDRIVGGVDGFIEDWPWQVSLQENGQHRCGGSLVSPRWIVTAAHCFAGNVRELSRWKVMSGETHMNAIGGSSVDRIILHGKYDTDKNDYDLAMMRLSSPISVGDKRKPACLPPKFLEIPDKAAVVVTGWGLLKEEGKASSTLQKANVEMIARSTCSSSAIYGSYITPRMICAGNLKGGVDACQGDSGGPLVYFSSFSWDLVGVVSWGVGCAQQNRPGVYSNVDDMLNWIYTVIEKNQ
ncbi:transmembrane protease serine 4a isoform X1 [Cyprinodon tularosa]|uniref:transmembrane protease serine 4a isoform X1 n=2 Tax=Cyprinodon tularosa TaxID=77115 RepID=UPI0018E254B1|nr:transmembrane protease serine 4a isoform X1 [Cyprinodon tularosa]